MDIGSLFVVGYNVVVVREIFSVSCGVFEVIE